VRSSTASNATRDPETFKKIAGSFGLIVNTVSARIDLDAYLSLLALDGALVNVGAPAEPLSLNVFSLLRSVPVRDRHRDTEIATARSAARGALSRGGGQTCGRDAPPRTSESQMRRFSSLFGSRSRNRIELRRETSC
jgi:hypothetical protein